MYSLNVVLLDPGVDSIPRRKNRDALRQDGRIVEISLPRGAQGPEAQKKLTSAFPHIRAKARLVVSYSTYLITSSSLC